MEPKPGRFYLGEAVDPKTHERTGDAIELKSDQFTTHGVIVGMTGSGKTGLGVVLLEEALLAGVPTLIIDPKGDMGNLLLGFPDFAPSKFEPWVSESEAETAGITTGALAEKKATLWKNGLASWGIEGERIRRLHNATDFTIYTPGSTAGVPLDVVGSLKAPGTMTDMEIVRDEVEGFVTSLLGMVGIEADPISSREHVLLANLIEHAWAAGEDLDLASLVMRVQTPPMRRLGVFELDAFYPAKDRTALAMRLNGLIASPSFASWTAGAPIDIDLLLRSPEGKPRAAIVSLVHLSDEERQFVVTLLLSKMITWMQGQSGTTDLRALIYMDEAFGFVPPTAAPPSKKPILTLLKKARAFGVGMVLSTQNPVDLDYKALSNAGTWMIGRLQTERDKGRLMDGLRSAAGDTDISAIEATISGLGKREFLLHSTRTATPSVFGTRWAMSYLAGPLSRTQIDTLMGSHRTALEEAPSPGGTPGGVATDDPSTPESLGADESLSPPAVATGISTYFLDPAAEWASEIGLGAPTGVVAPAVAVRVNLLYDDTRADVKHQEEWEAVFFPLTANPTAEDARAVDYDDRDLRTTPLDDPRFRLSDVPLDKSSYFKKLETDLKEHLYRTRSVEVWKNSHLKLYSRVGETREDFLARCDRAAEDREDVEAAKLRNKLKTQMERIQVQLAKAEDRVEELEADTSARRGQELIAGAGDLIGAFLGGRSRTRGIASKINRMASRRSQTSRTKQRLETAENRVAEKLDQLEQIELDLADSLLEIDALWQERAAEIESVEIGLEKTDIQIQQTAVVWVPA